MLRTNSYDELIAMIMGSPKLRSPSMGYTSEKLLLEKMLRGDERFSNFRKPSDNGPDSKVDLFFDFSNGRRYRVQVKSIYTNTIRQDEDGVYSGSVGITNNSKKFVFEEGEVVFNTKCPPRLDYDILAASLFVITGNPDDFLFMPSYYLGYPTSQSRIPEAYRCYFAGSAEAFTWPLGEGSRWTTDIVSLLDDRLGMRI